MAHWLFKTEPDEFSLDDLRDSKNSTTRWDGIRNYQARNFIRDNIKPQDTVWIYHSQCKPTGLVGLAKVVSESYPDPAQWDAKSPYYDKKSEHSKPRWYCVDIQYRQTFPRMLPLSTIKQDDALADMVLVKQGRLSIQPITEAQAKHLLSLIDH